MCGYRAPEMQKIQIELCCIHKIHTWFWRLSTKRGMWNISLVIFILITYWNDLGHIGLKKTYYKINFICFFLLFKCSYYKTLNYICGLHYNFTGQHWSRWILFVCLFASTKVARGDYCSTLQYMVCYHYWQVL